MFSALLNQPQFLFGRLNSPFFYFFKIRKPHRAPSFWQVTDWLHLVTQHCVSYRNAGSTHHAQFLKSEDPLGVPRVGQPKEERPGMDRVELETDFTALVSSMQAWSAASTPRSLRTFLCPCDSSRTPQMQTHQAQHRFVCFLKKLSYFVLQHFLVSSLCVAPNSSMFCTQE